MASYTITYNGDPQDWTVEGNKTIEQILADKNLQAVLGFDPARVRVLVNGVEVAGTATVADGSEIELEDRAAQKAS